MVGKTNEKESIEKRILYGDPKKSRAISFYLFIVAIGVSFFSGSVRRSRICGIRGMRILTKKNLMDIQVMSTLGLTDEDIKVLKQVDGIENVEAGYSTDALCAGTESQAVLHIMSMLPSMNELTWRRKTSRKTG